MAFPWLTSRPHSMDITHSVVLLRTSDKPDAETTTWQYTPLTRDKNPCPSGIRTCNPSKRAAADPHLRQRDHLDWREYYCYEWKEWQLLDWYYNVLQTFAHKVIYSTGKGFLKAYIRSHNENISRLLQKRTGSYLVPYLSRPLSISLLLLFVLP